MEIIITDVEVKYSGESEYKIVKAAGNFKASAWKISKDQPTPGYDMLEKGHKVDVEVITNEKDGRKYKNIMSAKLVALYVADDAPTTQSTTIDASDKDSIIPREVAVKAAAVLFQGTGEPIKMLAAADLILKYILGQISTVKQ